jgi:hypothetical protein
MIGYQQKEKKYKKFVLEDGRIRPISIEIFTYIIIVLTFLSTLVGITNNDIYLDGQWINAQWLGQDLVTLVVVLPLLWWSFKKMLRHDEVKWMLVYAGIMFYFVYTYAFFVFEAHLTVLYFFHLPIFSFSIFSFLISLKYIFDSHDSLVGVNDKLRGSIAGYLLLISGMIALIWLSQIFSFLFDPTYELDFPNDEVPMIIYSLDLAIVIPLMLMSSALLYTKKRIGYLLTGIMLVKTSLLGLALLGMSISLWIQDLSTDYFLLCIWAGVVIFGGSFSIKFIKSI